MDDKSINEKLGRKYDGNKPRWDLLPWAEIKEVVEVLTFGSEKYEDSNWQHVFPRSRYVGAAMRHFTDWLVGEKIDLDSGKSHLAHCICCLLFLMWADKNDKQTIILGMKDTVSNEQQIDKNNM